MGKKTNQQVQTSSPWQPQQQYLTDVFGQAQQQYYGGGPEYFPGATYVPFARQTEEALGLQEQRARGGSPAEQQLGQQLAGTLRGDYLGANPYLDDVVGAATRGVTEQFEQSVLPGIAAQFGAGGRTGSGIHQQALAQAGGELAQAVGDVEARIRGQDYGAERGRQLQAAGLVPTASALDYQNIDRLRGVGAATEQQGRDILQDQINRFNFYQQRPAQQLAQYAGLIGGQYGGEQSGYTRQGLGQTAGRVLGGVLPFFL